MPTLAEMIAAKKLASQPQPTPATKELDNGESHGDTASVAEPGGETSIESTAPATSSAPIPPVTAPASQTGIKLGGLKLGGLKLGAASRNPAGNTGTGAAGTGDTAVNNESGPSDHGESVGGRVADGDSSEPAKPAGLGLAAIAGLGSGIPEPTQLIDEADLNDRVDGLDLVDCTAPDRELPQEMTDQMISFVKSLDSIFQLVADPEMFVDMVRKTQREMQEYPALGKLLCDADVRVAIRGMRQSAGLAQVKKQAAKESRSKTAKVNSAAVTSAMDSLLSLAGSTAFD